MKKAILAVIFILIAGLAVYGQSSPIDLILLLDTSQSMSSSYDIVNNYLTGAFLAEYLRVGDTFHLIPFSQSQRLDAARRINGIGDVETIIARMLIQYPVETGNDVGSALNYAEQYITYLPTRPKKIVLITTGGRNADAILDTNNLVIASRQRIGTGNTLDYILVTPGQQLTNLPRSGRIAAARTVQIQPVQTQPVQPTQAQPVQTQPVQPTQAQPVQPTQTQSVQPAAVQTQPVIPEPVVIAPVQTQPEPVQIQPEPVITPPVQTQHEPAFSDPVQITQPEPVHTQTVTQPATVTQSSAPVRAQTSSGISEAWYSSLPFIIGIIIFALLLLGLLIFLLSRKLGSSPNRAMTTAAKSASGASAVSRSVSAQETSKKKTSDSIKDQNKIRPPAQSRRTTPYDNIKNKPVEINPDGPLLLNLFVEDQNTAIGKRNIHSLKSGYKLTVGGGKSDDFLIFLVSMPANLGEISRNGSKLTFIPNKPKYFPEIGSNEVNDCINKTIRIISDKQYEMCFRFEMYEDPLIALNRMLTSLNVPG